ncbi:MAG: hypothetical protein IPM63_06705 [Acidobacteriota bacterium]|nr:MAG: hypothetical protein IPM63_06705 [Acidobacteriota bacterium]
MKELPIRSLVVALALFAFAAAALAQSPNKLKRTTYKTETIESGVGGTVSIIGSPFGSIRVEGWSKNEVEISAEIEVTAANEADLAELAKVTGFMIDEGLTKISVITVGPHDKKYLKKAFKDFPKRLRYSPFRIDYVVRVPHYTDLMIDGGKGDLAIAAVEGSMKIEFLESNAVFDVSGGSIQATIGVGTATVNVLKPSWRGRFADIQVAAGRIDVLMPKDMNANLFARVLRTGTIENTFDNIKPARRTTFTETSMDAVAGNGGARLSFTVGDGTLLISPRSEAKIAEK